MTTTTTLSHPAPDAAHAMERPVNDALAVAGRMLLSLGRFLQMPAPTVPEARAQLLQLASTYESTQPSYAADLRAAAQYGA